LIYTLNKVDRSTRRELIYIIKNKNKVSEKVKLVINKVVASGGIAYATEKMIEYRNAALSILHEFEESETRNGLEDLVRFTTDRKY
jgi:octaprenyl-diphosphate synthase